MIVSLATTFLVEHIIVILLQFAKDLATQQKEMLRFVEKEITLVCYLHADCRIDYGILEGIWCPVKICICMCQSPYFAAYYAMTPYFLLD